MSETQQPKNSGAAIAALVTSLLGIPLVPIILGIVGLVGIKKSNGAKKGGGFAIAGIVIGALAILIVVGASLLVPVINSGREKAVATKNVNNVRSCNLALMSYAADNEGAFPASLQDLVPDYIEDASILQYFSRNPEVNGQPFEYVVGLDDNSPSQTPIIIAPVAERYGQRVVGFVDGAVRLVPEADFQAMRNK